MALLKYFWLCYAFSLLECTTASQVSATQLNPTAPLNLSSGPESSGHPNRISRILSDIPRPTRNQTIGSYFDTLLGSSTRVRSLEERHLFQSDNQVLLTSSWADDQGYFNISLDKCLDFKTVAGIYTSRDGTRDKATILDINKDLRFRLAGVAENEHAMASRVYDNAERASLEAERYLQTAICGYNVGTNGHDELRHLLALDGHWVALLSKSAMYGSIGAAIYTDLLNKNAPIGQAAGVTVVAAGLTIMNGVIMRLHTNGRINFLEATIINTFTAWYRQAVQVGSDSQGSTCIPEIVVHDALGSLPDYSDPRYHLDAITTFQLGQTCRK